jgi:methionine synthase II (cobalamin-independent)
MAYDRPMFATLHGAYPAIDPGDVAERDLATLVRRVLEDQLEAGIGLLTDGGLPWPDPGAAILEMLGGPVRPVRDRPLSVEGWAFAAEAATGTPVKQCLPGPYTLGRRFASADVDRRDLTLALADALAGELGDLAAAGCPFIQIDEDGATAIGVDVVERALFVEAHEHLLAGLGEPGAAERPHLSLAIVGGDADAAGPETIFAAPYNSHMFDLIAGPDNWRLITRAPAERGIVVGVVDAGSAVDDPAVIVWAVDYAASTHARGEARIGIATSGSLAAVPRAEARRKIDLLGRAVVMIDRRHEQPIGASLDPRATRSRGAALGRWEPDRHRAERD